MATTILAILATIFCISPYLILKHGRALRLRSSIAKRSADLATAASLAELAKMDSMNASTESACICPPRTPRPSIISLASPTGAPVNVVNGMRLDLGTEHPGLGIDIMESPETHEVEIVAHAMPTSPRRQPLRLQTHFEQQSTNAVEPVDTTAVCAAGQECPSSACRSRAASALMQSPRSWVAPSSWGVRRGSRCDSFHI